MLAFGVLWLLHQGPLENYDGMRTDTWTISSLSATRSIAGWYHFPLHGQPAAGPESGECKGKRVPLFIRLVFAHEYSGGKGDNCLLTRGAAYVDLPFSPLIA